MEQIIENDKLLAPKQMKIIPTGTVPKFVEKLNLPDADKNNLIAEIKRLGLSQRTDVPTIDAVPGEHVQDAEGNSPNLHASTIPQGTADGNNSISPEQQNNASVLPNETISIRHQLKDNIVKAGYSEEAAERALDGGGIGRREDSRFAGAQTHTPEQQQVMNEYESSVDSNLADFVKVVVNSSYSTAIDNQSYFLSPVSQQQSSDIKNRTGVDLEGFKRKITAKAIRHIDKRHGENGSADKTMANAEDLARIQYVLDNYDDISVLEQRSSEYRDSQNNPAPMIRYGKQIDGHYYVVEAIPNTKAKTVAIVTAYMSDGSQDTNKMNQTDALKMYNPLDDVQNAHTVSDSFSASTILQGTAEVNNSISPEQQNNSFSPGRPDDTGGNLERRFISNTMAQDAAEGSPGMEEAVKMAWEQSGANRRGISFEESLAQANEYIETHGGVNNTAMGFMGGDIDSLSSIGDAVGHEDQGQIQRLAADFQDMLAAKFTAIIMDRLPASNRKKWRTLQRISMLSNPKTHIRSVVGNAAMMGATLGTPIVAGSQGYDAPVINGGI